MCRRNRGVVVRACEAPLKETDSCRSVADQRCDDVRDHILARILRGQGEVVSEKDVCALEALFEPVAKVAGGHNLPLALRLTFSVKSWIGVRTKLKPSGVPNRGKGLASEDDSTIAPLNVWCPPYESVMFLVGTLAERLGNESILTLFSGPFESRTLTSFAGAGQTRRQYAQRRSCPCRYSSRDYECSSWLARLTGHSPQAKPASGSPD